MFKNRSQIFVVVGPMSEAEERSSCGYKVGLELKRLMLNIISIRTESVLNRS